MIWKFALRSLVSLNVLALDLKSCLREMQVLQLWSIIFLLFFISFIWYFFSSSLFERTTSEHWLVGWFWMQKSLYAIFFFIIYFSACGSFFFFFSSFVNLIMIIREVGIVETDWLVDFLMKRLIFITFIAYWWLIHDLFALFEHINVSTSWRTLLRGCLYMYSCWHHSRYWQIINHLHH